MRDGVLGLAYSETNLSAEPRHFLSHLHFFGDSQRTLGLRFLKKMCPVNQLSKLSYIYRFLYSHSIVSETGKFRRDGGNHPAELTVEKNGKMRISAR